MSANPDLPTVVVIRDPDYEDQIIPTGEMNVVYVDLGSQFNGPKDFPGHMEEAEAREWIQAYRDEVAHLDEHNAARTAVEEIMDHLDERLEEHLR